nr:response regulator [Candidatus Dependentiae bacterium]
MKKIRVFIIEDEKDTLNMLITYLKKNSFEVSGYALNGNDAIQIIKNNQSDIILTDIGLPGEFDGIETIEIIQQENDIPVIFITGFDSQDLIDRAKKIKYATYLHKPIDLNNLSAAIEIGLYQKNSDNIFINSISEAYSYNKIIYNNNNIPADYIIITVNDNFAKILGLDKKNICGRKASELYDLQNVELKNDFYNLLKIYSNLKPNGEKNEFERYSPITRKWYKIITYSLKNEYFITLRSDVTELKRKDKYLLEFYTSLQLIPSIVVITDVDGNFEFVNSAFERVTGYIIADVQGISTKILKSENYDPGYIKNLWDTIKSGNIWRGEFYNRKKNGELYYEFAIIGSIKNE